MPYSKNYQMYACPGAPFTPRFYGELEPYPTPTDSIYRFHSGYGINWYSNERATDRGEWLWLNEDSIRRPAQVIHFAESYGSVVSGPNVGHPAGTFTWANWVAATQNYPGVWWAGVWHNDGFNASFVDGHAKWLKPGSCTESMFDQNAP